MRNICRRLRRKYLLIFLYLIVLYCIKEFIFPFAFNPFTGWFPNEPKREIVSQRTRLHIPQRNATERELILLQMIFRHGHRAPFNLYPNDNHPESFWKEGLGMLTQLGRLQHYVMGDHLLKRYKSFITTNPKEVEVLNADSDRCQFGAFAFIAGLYSPAEEYRFTDEIRWQPVISRHYVDKRNRYVLSRRKCSVASDDEHEMKMSREADDMREKYAPLYNFWSEHSGRNIKDWTRAADLAKTLACERDYNLTMPEWALRYWSELQRQAGLSYYWNFRTKLIHRYRIGPLLKYMLKNMEDKIRGATPEKRVYVYSTHGSHLACLLMALRQYNMKAPPHASTIVLELWKENETNYSVRWLYFNSSNPEKRIHP
ncbi:Lysosomal acid phosphatase, partial [Stegodyphus mimosarum]